MLSNSQYEELTRLLVADVRALVPLALPTNHPVSEAHIRLMAVILRRWLVDGDLQKLLQPLKKTALFDVQGNTQAYAYAVKSTAFRYYLTGGIRVNGRPISHIYESESEASDVDQSFMQEGRASVSLKKFLAQPRLLHCGQWFNTGQILRFAANKLGGNHLDFDRSGEWAQLDAANSFLRFGGPALRQPPEGCEVYLIIEPSSEEIIGAVHLEVIAAAASFVQMSIGGEQLCELQTEKSLMDQLRKLFRRRPDICMIEHPNN